MCQCKSIFRKGEKKNYSNEKCYSNKFFLLMKKENWKTEKEAGKRIAKSGEKTSS